MSRPTSLAAHADPPPPAGSEPVGLRLIDPSDAVRLAALQTADRELLTRWEPQRDDRYFTAAGQAEVIDTLLKLHAAGSCLPWVITGDEGVLGRVTVRDLIGRPFHKATVGYWVAGAFTGHGYATAALSVAVGELRRRGDLHRIEATTQVANEASHRVLRKNDFGLMGVAREHIYTNGRWHDELLWELVLPTSPPDQERKAE